MINSLTYSVVAFFGDYLPAYWVYDGFTADDKPSPHARIYVLDPVFSVTNAGRKDSAETYYWQIGIHTDNEFDRQSLAIDMADVLRESKIPLYDATNALAQPIDTGRFFYLDVIGIRQFSQTAVETESTAFRAYIDCSARIYRRTDGVSPLIFTQ